MIHNWLPQYHLLTIFKNKSQYQYFILKMRGVFCLRGQLIKYVCPMTSKYVKQKLTKMQGEITKLQLELEIWILLSQWIKQVYRESLGTFSSVQSLSRVLLFATPWIAARQASLSITNSRSWLKLMSIESVMPSNHLILSSPSPPAPNPSQHQSLFQWVSSLHEVAKVLEFQL